MGELSLRNSTELEMNILTIDTDYISDNYLGGVIGDLVSSSPPLSDSYWNFIVDHVRPSEASMSENRNNIRYIFKVFMQSLKEGTKVVFGVHHDTILCHIPESAKDLRILNIDHHNDIAYTWDQKVRAEEYGDCTEANWVSVLNSRISEYTWVGNQTSAKYTGKEAEPYLYTEINNTEDRDNLDYAATKWDLVYVCLSPNYTYDTHWIYFYLLLDLYETVSGTKLVVDSTRYSNRF
jgi:hypothetical protein